MKAFTTSFEFLDVLLNSKATAILVKFLSVLFFSLMIVGFVTLWQASTTGIEQAPGLQPNFIGMNI